MISYVVIFLIGVVVGVAIEGRMRQNNESSKPDIRLA